MTNHPNDLFVACGYSYRAWLIALGVIVPAGGPS